MKRSEYVKERLAYWRTPAPHYPGLRVGARSAADMVELDVRAAEAAGVVWEEEQGPLPERLDAYPSGLTWWLGPSNRNWHSSAEKERGYKEAARRYNLWEEARKEAEADERGSRE